MSVKLVKKDRMKSYQIQVYLSKYRKYKWVNTYCSNKKDAQSILKQYQKADIEYKLGLRESQLPDMEQPTIRDAVDSYLTSVENSIQSKGTYKLKKFVLNEFVERVNARVRLNEVNQADADNYVKYLKTKPRGSGAFKGVFGISESAINIRKRYVIAFFNWCVNEAQWLKHSPIKLKQVKVPTKVKLITPSQFEMLLQNEPDENLRAYYKLAYYCGLRRCEINHTELTLDLNKQDVLMVTETKGVKDWNRDVPIHKDLIKDWQLVKSAMYKLDRISHGCRDAFKRAGLYIPYQTTMHSLRHTFATNKALEGMPMIELAKLMGHEETSTTEKYANATRELIVILRNESNTDMIHA
jgi:integrase